VKMQKFRIFSSLFLVVSLLSGIISPIVFSFSLEPYYDYSEYREKINISEENTKEWIFTRSFESPRTTFFLVLPSLPSPDFRVDWIIDGVTYSRSLDLEDGDTTLSTFPLVTSARSNVSFRIVSDFFPDTALLVTARHDAIGERIVYAPDDVHASTEIVSRKEWGADESFRYISDAEQEKRLRAYEERGRTPRIIEMTETEAAAWKKENDEMSAINKKDPLARDLYSLTRTEWGKKMWFPYRKSKQVDRIVIHHTAESLDKVADDETLIRAIYAYHARTKWWGDIWYHYIIGQRGEIYEGRAWGDYVEWAHVYGNNRGTVGISVIGNYNELHLNKDQKVWLISAVEYVARKYGIDVREKTSGAYPCGSSSLCNWKEVTGYRLSWHRDFGTTSCPGDNLYAVIPEIRETVGDRIGKIDPIYNRDDTGIYPVAPEDQVEYVIKKPDTSNILIKRISSSWGLPIRIRLSYPHDTLDMLSSGYRLPRLLIDGKKVPLKKWETISVWKVWNNQLEIKIGEKSFIWWNISLSSDLVTLSSWDRVPSWDIAKRYNDNRFRSKILISNNDGKLLVVNELPIEDYLKWLGEVSNSDPLEKIKTITVAARTYAYYYQDPKNRKYNTPLYDGSDNPDEFQKYLWYGYEERSPNVTKAVNTTKGKIITYASLLVKAWYFSSSDGKTRSYKEYCEANNPGKICTDIPYLQSVTDPAWVGKTRSGHGVGISGIGATYAANLGKKYDEIIMYYMSGVTISEIKNLKK
jgi:hypothetical protein